MKIKHLLLFALLITFLSCDYRKNKIATLIEDIEFWSSKDYSKALEKIKEAEEYDKENNDIQYIKAKVKLQHGLDDETIKILESLIKNKFKVDTCNYILSNIFFEKSIESISIGGNESDRSKYEDLAIKYSEATIEANNLFFDAHIIILKTLHNKGYFMDAIKRCERIMIIFPESNELKLHIAINKWSIGNHEESALELAELLKTLKEKELVANALLYISKYFIETKNYENALISLNTATHNSPLNAQIYLQRAVLYELLGKKTEMCQDLHVAQTLGEISVVELINKNCK